MTVKPTNGLRKDMTTKSTILNQLVRLGEPAGIANRAILKLDSMDHAISIEEVVTSNGFVKWVCAILNVDVTHSKMRSAKGYPKYRSSIV